MPAAANLSVFVVDDQMTIRSLVRSSLRQIGVADVREYSNAKDALAGLQLQVPHIVISDQNMPDLTGMEFLRAMRADGRLKKTAFILLTGRADRDLVIGAVKAGANNYLVKPFTVMSLKQKIEQVVGGLS